MADTSLEDLTTLVAVLAATDRVYVLDANNLAANSYATMVQLATYAWTTGKPAGPQFTTIELGHASDTTLARSGAGDVTIEGNAVYRAGGTDVPVADGGTGASTAAAAATALGVGTGSSPQFAAINVGHATNTTISQVAAGRIQVESLEVVLATMQVDLNANAKVITGHLADIQAERTTATEETVTADSGTTIWMNSASPQTLTIKSDAPAGFNCLVAQVGAGQVTIAAGGTGNVRNQSSHTKIAGQYGMVTVVVKSNAGTAPEVYLGGDTGT